MDLDLESAEHEAPPDRGTFYKRSNGSAFQHVVVLPSTPLSSLLSSLAVSYLHLVPTLPARLYSSSPSPTGSSLHFGSPFDRQHLVHTAISQHHVGVTRAIIRQPVFQQLRLILAHALCHNASMTMLRGRNMLYCFLTYWVYLPCETLIGRTYTLNRDVGPLSRYNCTIQPALELLVHDQGSRRSDLLR